MNRNRILLFVALLLILSACGNNKAASDPCAEDNLGMAVKPINDLQREFDDASALSANLPREQLDESISNMQRIRRAAEDIDPPACLADLKAHQLAHMNAVIETLIAFVGGADTATLNTGLALARTEHDRYTLELARLLGISPVPATPTP